MSPSYSTKNGIRYRFYVSSALLRGRKSEVGSVGRVSAQEIEGAVLVALRSSPTQAHGRRTEIPDLIEQVEQVVIAAGHVMIRLVRFREASEADGETAEIQIPWCKTASGPSASVEANRPLDPPNEAALLSIARSHAWLRWLQDGTYPSVEALAEAQGLHPKVVRLGLRLAFLSPTISSAIVEGGAATPVTLANIPKVLPLSWKTQQRSMR